ncbi:MAG: hypothetical protein JWQ66_4364 [Mucilaginibacter sp.]|nr:hypothetical protein [Mucilaginibacter sp.]
MAMALAINKLLLPKLFSILEKVKLNFRGISDGVSLFYFKIKPIK